MDAETVGDWVDAVQPLLWPVAGLLVFVALWRSRLLHALLGSLQSFRGFGVSFEFSKRSAKETQEALEDILGRLRWRLARELDQLARRHRVAELRQTVMRSVVLPHMPTKSNLRATIHVADPLLVDHLYQLLDYYPRGGGKGRCFSLRSGMIGLVWRRGESDSQNLAGVDSDKLVRTWGMTREEADSSQAAGRDEFLAVLLDDGQGVTTGVWYMDASAAGVFGGDEREREAFRTELREAFVSSGLSGALKAVVDQVAEWSPQVDPRGSERL